MGLNQNVHPFSGYIRIPGQVPGKTPLAATPRLDPEVQKLLTDTPPPVTLDRMLDRPVMRAQDAVSNLGLSKSLESALSHFISKEAIKSLNQIQFQKAINATLMEASLPPDLQAVISARSARFYRTTLQKAGRGEFFSMSELSELKKSKMAIVAHPNMKPVKDPTTTKIETKIENDNAAEGAGAEVKKSKRDPKKDPALTIPKGALREDLQKSTEGEGTKGGKVIGHYPSGKPIYASASFMTSEHIKHSEDHPHGSYHIEDHGAGVHALMFKKTRDRKPKYEGTFSSTEAAKKGIEHHVQTGWSKKSSIGSEINPKATWIKQPLQKAAQGEGSKGGKVIGHTSTGKPIYDDAMHDSHLQRHFTPKDHMDAAVKHRDLANKHSKGSKEREHHVIQQNKHRFLGGDGRAAHELPKPDKNKTAKKPESKSPKGWDHSAWSGDYMKKAQKGDKIGGKFVARVTQKGKHKYYYDEKKYKDEHGEHVTGEQARSAHVHASVQKAVETAGRDEVDITHFRDLVKKFGVKPIHESVRKHVDEGTLKFKAGRFSSSKKMEKALVIQEKKR